MDKHEWINQFQDKARREGRESTLKNYVLTREGPLDAKLSASVSPCVWMYDSPFQISVSLLGGGNTIVVDNDLRLEQATEADIARMLDSVGIVKCGTRGCRNPAFDPGTSLKHRDGKCENCAIDRFDKELKAARVAEQKKLAQLDRKQRARGFTHRVEAWVHADGGDKQISIWLCNPTDATIRSELARSGALSMENYTLHQL